jgi:anaerobic ribonucleoside-triphosphate reductase
MITVIKRNGDLANFNLENISIALSKCYLAHYGNLTQELKDEITEITYSVYTHHILPFAGNEFHDFNVLLNIENIQNYVVCTLIEFGKHELAEQYTEYRLKQKEFRDNYLSKTFTIKKKENIKNQRKNTWMNLNYIKNIKRELKK